MNKINVNQAPFGFSGVFPKVIPNHSANYTIIKDCRKPKLSMFQRMFRISNRGQKQNESHPAFGIKLKARLKSFFDNVIIF